MKTQNTLLLHAGRTNRHKSKLNLMEKRIKSHLRKDLAAFIMPIRIVLRSWVSQLKIKWKARGTSTFLRFIRKAKLSIWGTWRLPWQHISTLQHNYLNLISLKPLWMSDNLNLQVTTDNSNSHYMPLIPRLANLHTFLLISTSKNQSVIFGLSYSTSKLKRSSTTLTSKFKNSPWLHRKVGLYHLCLSKLMRGRWYLRHRENLCRIRCLLLDICRIREKEVRGWLLRVGRIMRMTLSLKVLTSCSRKKKKIWLKAICRRQKETILVRTKNQKDWRTNFWWEDLQNQMMVMTQIPRLRR